MTSVALKGIRTFLESKSCYDILPESFRLIVFDNKLSITRSLQALVTNGKLLLPTFHLEGGLFQSQVEKSPHDGACTGDSLA